MLPRVYAETTPGVSVVTSLVCGVAETLVAGRVVVGTIAPREYSLTKPLAQLELDCSAMTK